MTILVYTKSFVKKLQGGTYRNTVNSLNTVGTSLLKLRCSKNKLDFLIDSEASCSTVPKSLYNSNFKDGVLQAANGTKIFTYGNINLHLNLGFRRNMYLNFILADVLEPILGADFLEKYNLTLKMSKRIVQDEETGISIKGYKTFSSLYAIRDKSAFAQKNHCQNLMNWLMKANKVYRRIMKIDILRKF